MPRLTFVIGGAASGKSAHAEALARATGLPRIYVATAQAFDEEMAAKIAAHRAARGPDWETVEAPLDLPQALGRIPAGRVVLVDCLTLWLSNLVLADADTDAAGAELLSALGACASDCIVVSNEVGQGIVPDHPLGRRFRGAQGRLNQAVAAAADRVETVIAGLPLVLKG